MRHRPAVTRAALPSVVPAFPVILFFPVRHRRSPRIGLLLGTLDPRQLSRGCRLEAVGARPRQLRPAATRLGSPAPRGLHPESEMCESVSSAQTGPKAPVCQGVSFARM